MDSQQLFQTLIGNGWPLWLAIHDPRLAAVFGSNTEALRKAAWRGNLPVPITRGVGNRIGVRLTDLVGWMVRAPVGTPASSQPDVAPLSPRRGRPRKSALTRMGESI